jgi:hypothetical protein
LSFLSHSFLFLKISSKNNNKNIQWLNIIFENKNGDLKISKHFKFLHPTRFSYKKFNEHDKLKFMNDLIYFLNLACGGSL